MKNPLISIVVPTFNRADLISETLDSIISQTYTNWECIVIDDGSTDDTEKVVQHFQQKDQRFQFYKRPQHLVKGGCSCRNYGFEMAKGSFINWFDDDDLMMPNKLAQQLAIAEQQKSDVVVCQTQFFENDISNLKRFWNKTFTPKYLPLIDFITFRLAWSVNAPLWRTSFLENKILFNVALPSSQDWEFHAKLLADFPKVAIMYNTFVLCRIHLNRIGAQKNTKRIVNRFSSRIQVFDILKKKERLHPEINHYFSSYFINQLKYISKDDFKIKQTLIAYCKKSTPFVRWYFNIYPRILMYVCIHFLVKNTLPLIFC